MAAMPSAGPTGNVYVMAPHNGYPVMMTGTTQGPLYPGYQPQIHLISPAVEPHASLQPAQRGLREGKVLGAVQILIGLMHLGVGIIAIFATSTYYVTLLLYGGSPFWGAFWFIISGSVSVAAEKQPQSPCLLNASVGLNIFSSICSAVAIILLITDMSIMSSLPYPDYSYPPYNNNNDPGVTLSCCGVMLVFCILEFFVAVTATHFGCQVACCRPQSNAAMIFPEVCVANPGVTQEPVQPPPSYSHMP